MLKIYSGCVVSSLFSFSECGELGGGILYAYHKKVLKDKKSISHRQYESMESAKTALAVLLIQFVC